MSENNRDRVEEGRLRMMFVGSVFGSWLGVFIGSGLEDSRALFQI